MGGAWWENKHEVQPADVELGFGTHLLYSGAHALSHQAVLPKKSCVCEFYIHSLCVNISSNRHLTPSHWTTHFILHTQVAHLEWFWYCDKSTPRGEWSWTSMQCMQTSHPLSPFNPSSIWRWFSWPLERAVLWKNMVVSSRPWLPKRNPLAG